MTKLLDMATRREFERKCNYAELQFIIDGSNRTYVFYRCDPPNFHAETIGRCHFEELQRMGDEGQDKFILELQILTLF